MNATQLNSMSVKDLLALNKMIVAVVKEKQRMDNRTASFNFRAGDSVSYQSSRIGGRVTGKVLEVKRTKVVVETMGKRYLVPASMLAAA